MQLFCPSCQASAAAVDRCPRCGDRLVTPAEAYTPAPAPVPVAPDPIRPTAPGRVAVGSVAAFGLYLALREFATALVDDPQWWNTETGLALACGVRGVGALVGGLLGGAGRRQGWVTGLIVGAIFAGLLLAADTMTHGPITVTLVGLALGLGLVAGLAGFVGGWIWPPEAEIPVVVPIPRRGSSLARMAADQKQERASKPTSWLRILLGSAVIVVGVAGADSARVNLKKISGGYINTGGPTQAAQTDLHIATLATVLGAILAGAGTGAGLRHGLLTGAITGLGLATLGRAWTDPVLVGLYELVDQSAPSGSRGAFVLASVILMTCAVGGWLGGQVFPPLVPVWLRPKRVQLS